MSDFNTRSPATSPTIPVALPDAHFSPLPGGNVVQIKPATAQPWAVMGMFEVTINGQVQHMTLLEIERTNFSRRSAPAQPLHPQAAAALEGQRSVGMVGPVIVAESRVGVHGGKPGDVI